MNRIISFLHKKKKKSDHKAVQKTDECASTLKPEVESHED